MNYSFKVVLNRIDSCYEMRCKERCQYLHPPEGAAETAFPPTRCTAVQYCVCPDVGAFDHNIHPCGLRTNGFYWTDVSHRPVLIKQSVSL